MIAMMADGNDGNGNSGNGNHGNGNHSNGTSESSTRQVTYISKSSYRLKTF